LGIVNDTLFDWDDANIGHIAEHDVTPEEAEPIILGDPLDSDFDTVNGEERWSYLGETGEGRILRVWLTVRGPKMRVVTSFEPSKSQINLYLEWKAGLQ
jgi:uncharacterized DUF497 family protein